MGEPEVLAAARAYGQARLDWAQSYLIARMQPGKTAKDAEAAADEECIQRVIETGALYFIARHREAMEFRHEHEWEVTDADTQ
jgi:hypothetical protein